MCENHFGKVLLLNTISTNQFLQAFMCFVPFFSIFLFALIKEKTNINIIIIMFIIIVQKYAQTPQLN